MAANTTTWAVRGLLAFGIGLGGCGDDQEAGDADGGSANGTQTAGLDGESGSTGDGPTTGEPAYPGYPYESNYVELSSGLSMHYLDEGEGRPIVLLHGLPTQAYLWRNMIPELQTRGRVIAPDLINFGKSSKTEPLDPEQHAQLVEQFIDELGLQDVTFVLHDWGGAFGFSYAARHPENIRALVFFETIILPFPDLSVLPEGFSDAVLHPQTGLANVVDNNFFVECFLLDPACGATRRQWSDDERSVYREPFLDTSSREQMYVLPQFLPFLDATGHPVLDPDGPGGEPAAPTPKLQFFEEYATYLGNTSTPKLFIYAEPGVAPGAPFAAQLEMMFPNLQTTPVGSAQSPTFHFIQEDAPDELASVIGEFLDGL